MSQTLFLTGGVSSRWTTLHLLVWSAWSPGRTRVSEKEFKTYRHFIGLGSMSGLR